MNLREILDLDNCGRDTFVGRGPRYPWGGLYGGQIVAQALIASARTVDDSFEVHSLRAYFIRRGDHHEPVRYEVDRIRDGRSFSTRRVVAHQATGAILNLEASFQRPEVSASVEAVALEPNLSPPESLTSTSWSPAFRRSFLPEAEVGQAARVGAGRVAAWLKAAEPLGDEQIHHRAALAYLSDDLPTDAVIRAHPVGAEPEATRMRVLFTASLDHSIWFHQRLRADEWHLHDFTCHSFGGGRGLSIGHVFSRDGSHVASVAQEVLLRDGRDAVGYTTS